MRLPHARTIVLAGLIGAGLLSVAPVSAQTRSGPPTPALVSPSWELDFTFQEPKRIVVQIPGHIVPQAFWYVTYVVTNNTEREQIWLPAFDMLLRDGRLIRSDVGISPAVFDAIKRAENNQPLVESLQIAGPIQIGEDQARYGVAIFPEALAEVGEFTLFVGGLSGETQPLTDSQGAPVSDASGNPIVLRKTLQVDYNVRGDELYAGDPVDEKGRRWIMR